MKAKEKRYLHICEVCGKTEVLTPMEAHMNGWDYPPMMGSFGVVSPRTCGNCTINKTLWWALMTVYKKESELDEVQMETLKRILSEPESIEVDEEINE